MDTILKPHKVRPLNFLRPAPTLVESPGEAYGGNIQKDLIALQLPAARFDIGVFDVSIFNGILYALFDISTFDNTEEVFK